MSAHEALARALSDVYYADVPSGIDHEAAQRILADPAPLLAALAEAGVLEVEWNVAGVDSEGCEWTAGLQDDEPPTLSAWMKRDNGHHESRYVSGWTEVPR